MRAGHEARTGTTSDYDPKSLLRLSQLPNVSQQNPGKITWKAFVEEYVDSEREMHDDRGSESRDEFPLWSGADGMCRLGGSQS